MKWDGWGLYALLALIVTITVSYVTPLPGEQALVGVFQSLPSFGGVWDGLNAIAKNTLVFGIIVAAATILTYFLLPPRDTILPLSALMGAQVIEWIVKPLVERPRPSGALGSFPSSGALYYAAWLGAIAILVARRARSDLLRRVMIVLLLVVAALGGIARLHAGAHWSSDVVGSWLWAAAWVLWLRQTTRTIA